MELNEENLYLWLSMCPFTMLKKYELVQRLSILEIFEGIGKGGELDRFVGEANALKAKQMKSTAFLTNAINRMHAVGAEFISIKHKDYPKQLRQKEVVPPIGLYLKGRRELLGTTTIAVVGTRENTDYGAQVTRDICEGLKGYDITVVSGMAFGIDALAHSAAIDNDVNTIAVLASGVNIPSPLGNLSVYNRICERGLVVSEYPIDARAASYRFVERNRIVAGLSSLCLIVEADFNSGSLITANRALEQSREVFAVPGSIYSKKSEGTNNLIKNGSEVYTTVKSILGFINLQKTKNTKNSGAPILDFYEQTIYNLLDDSELCVSELSDLSGFTLTEVLNIVYSLEFKRLVIAKPNNIYKQRGQDI